LRRCWFRFISSFASSPWTSSRFLLQRIGATTIAGAKTRRWFPAAEGDAT
jgi:hypothetical protein